MQKVRLLLISTFSLLTFGLAPAAVMAAPPAPDCTDPSTLSPAAAIQCGANNAAGVPVNTSPTKTIDNTIHRVVNIISVAVGIAAVIMIIIAGFRYITSAGNQDKVKGAKNTLLYALIGLIVVALAEIIATYVLSNT